MNVNVREERVEWTAVDKSLTTVTRGARRSVSELREAIDAVKNVLGALGITVGAGALVKLQLDALQATAKFDDMAESTGATVEGLSAVQRVAKVGSHDFEGLTGQIGKMIKGLREGSEEGGKAAYAFDFVGVKTRDANGRFRDTSEILVDLARRLDVYTDKGEKVRLVQDALGKGAERYLPLLKDIAEGTDLHATVTTRQAAEAEQAEKNINRLKVAFEDAKRQLVQEFTPAIIEYTQKLLDAKEASGGWASALALGFTHSDENIDAQLAALRKRVAERNKAQLNERPRDGAGQAGSDFARMLLGVDESVLLARIEYLEKRKAAIARDAGAKGRKDPQSQLFEFADQPLDYEGNEDWRKRNAEYLKEMQFRAEKAAELEEMSQRDRREAEEAFSKAFKDQLEYRYHLVEVNADGSFRVTERLIQNEARAREIAAQSYRTWFEEIDAEQDRLIEEGAQVSAAIDAQRERNRDTAQRVLGRTFADEGELETFKLAHQRRLEILDEARRNELLTQSEYNDRKYLLEKNHQKAMYALEDEEARRRWGIQEVYRELDLESAGYFFGQMSALMNTQSRKQFEIGKKAAIAQTVIDTYRAAMGAYAALSSIYIVGPALGAAAAAAVIAAGHARIQQIRATEFGGGAVAMGTFPANPNTGQPLTAPGESSAPAQAPQRQTKIIHLHGDESTRYTKKQIRALLEEADDDGAFVFVDD